MFTYNYTVLFRSVVRRLGGDSCGLVVKANILCLYKGSAYSPGEKLFGIIMKHVLKEKAYQRFLFAS